MTGLFKFNINKNITLVGSYKKYEKMVVAINEPAFNCYANKGDWLNKANAPIALTWLEKLFPIKIKELKLHKKFFTGMSREEKEELFQN